MNSAVRKFEGLISNSDNKICKFGFQQFAWRLQWYHDLILDLYVGMLVVKHIKNIFSIVFRALVTLGNNSGEAREIGCKSRTACASVVWNKQSTVQFHFDSRGSLGVRLTIAWFAKELNFYLLGKTSTKEPSLETLNFALSFQGMKEPISFVYF